MASAQTQLGESNDLIVLVITFRMQSAWLTLLAPESEFKSLES